jgi:nicotinamide-nucleotide amidase
MQAEIITIGTELLLGQIVDTNAAFLARQLAAVGFDVYRQTTVGDNVGRIVDAVGTALNRCDFVITSGGIGPTVDDKTREAVAEATGQKLRMDPALLRHIAAFFERRGWELGENNPLQAYIPEHATPVHNPVGTAPGFIVKYQGSYVVSLPGVPRELYYLMEHTVLPFIQKEFGLETVIKTRILRTAGSGESYIDRRIAVLETAANPTVGLAAHPGAVDIRIAAKAKDDLVVSQMLDDMETRLRDILGDMIYGVDEETIAGAVVKQLLELDLKLALVETNTGGSVARRLTGVPDGLSVLKQSLTMSLEGAGEALLPNAKGPITLSAASAEILAARIQADTVGGIGMAIIGDEDPAVGPYSERTGNTYIAVSGSDGTRDGQLPFAGISADARTRTTNFALDLLRRYLLNLDPRS